MEAVQYKCPNCSGELTFKPDKQAFGCDFCLSTFTEEEIKQACADAENSIPSPEALQTQQEFSEHTNVYHCGSCGAEVICEENETATFCYYCHEPVIMSGKMSGDYTPDKVIGFKLTRENAIEKFKAWCGKRIFLPKDFNTDTQLEKMTGLYVPFWIADCDMKADFMGSAEKIRRWTSGSYRYTETKYYEIVRSAKVFTDGIPADGETKIDDLLMESIEPYNYNDAKDFSMSYLSGFFADKYDVDKAAVFPRIRSRAAEAAKNVIRNSIVGYDRVSARSENYRILNTKWQYMLLPVWFMTYRYNGEVYSFAINGQTGKLAGTPPLDKKKLALFSVGFGLISALIAFLIGGVL
ncbi:MAG: hypothetical protein E7500_06865 [Ruminococcus sp.]|nr:hypothetical protein [Ruminococcus sp.]